MEHRRDSKTTLSPVPPVLSGADQARFSPQLSWLFLQPNNSHCPTSSAHLAPRIGTFPKFINANIVAILVLLIQQRAFQPARRRTSGQRGAQPRAVPPRSG